MNFEKFLKLKIFQEKTTNKRYLLGIRLEPQEYYHWFVNFYYFGLDCENKELKFLRQKQEIKDKSFVIDDIFGI